MIIQMSAPVSLCPLRHPRQGAKWARSRPERRAVPGSPRRPVHPLAACAGRRLEPWSNATLRTSAARGALGGPRVQLVQNRVRRAYSDEKLLQTTAIASAPMAASSDHRRSKCTATCFSLSLAWSRLPTGMVAQAASRSWPRISPLAIEGPNRMALSRFSTS